LSLVLFQIFEFGFEMPVGAEESIPDREESGVIADVFGVMVVVVKGVS